MRRPLCTVLVLFVLVTNLLEAQESKSQSSETGAHSTVRDDAQVMSLLLQSHDINQQLPVRARFFLLTQQAQLASQMRVDWAGRGPMSCSHYPFKQMETNARGRKSPL